MFLYKANTQYTVDVVIVLSMRCSALCPLLCRCCCQKYNFTGPCRQFRRNASIFVSSYDVPRDLQRLTGVCVLFFSHRLDLPPNAFCPLQVLCSNRAEIPFDKEIICCFRHGISWQDVLVFYGGSNWLLICPVTRNTLHKSN